MAHTNSQSLCHVHALSLKAGHEQSFLPVLEPSPDDASHSPGLYEALETALWRGGTPAGLTGEPLTVQADVSDVLHPVTCIEVGS